MSRLLNAWRTAMLLLPIAAFGAGAPAPFEPVPEAEKALYRWDLKKNFYADEAAWKADLERARGLVAKMEASRGKLLSSPGALLGYFDQKRTLTDLVVKLYAYGEFRSATNTADRGPFEAYQALVAEVDARTSFARVEIMGLKPETLEAWVKEVPALGAYRYAIGDVVRMAPHTLSEKEEALLANMGPSLTAWQPVLYQMLFDRNAFATVTADGKEYNVFRDFDGLLQNPDPAVREKTFKAYYKSLRELSDLAGFGLLKEMKAYNDEAKLRGFDTYYNQTLFERYLTRPQVDNLYSQIESHLDLYRAFQEWKVARIASERGLKSPAIWDYELSLGGVEPPRFTAKQGSDLILAALSPLGPEYSAELGKLLDPKNGRLDIVGGPNRDQGAFCEAYYGYFMNNYQGLLGDVGTMAHEAGHAIHHQLDFNRNKTLFFTDGPGYMTESYAMINEWLLRDHLFKTTKDPELLKTYRKDALNEMMYLWELARRAQFEMLTYDGAAAGKISDSKGIDRISLEVGKRYDIFFGNTAELDVHWMRKHHYWSVPTYYVNYVVAHLLALKYYQLYQDDPKGFAEKYTAMVRNGFDRPASQLLKDFLGIDLGDPKFLEGTFQMMKNEFGKVKAAEVSK